MAIWTYGIGIVIVGVVILGLRVIQQYDRAVKLRFGTYSGVLNPGLRWIIPFVDRLITVDIRQKTIDLQPQDVMTKDQVNLEIDGVVFYAIEDPASSVLNVERIEKQLEDKATSELKEIVGSKTMTESLTQRENIAKALVSRLTDAITDKSTRGENKGWGVVIKSVQINNVKLPQQLIRAMSKQAEAEREKEARRTKAEGEFEASKKFDEASRIYKNNPEALRLRELQTYQEIGIEKNTLMMVIPSAMATGDGKWTLPVGVNELSKTVHKEVKLPVKK